MPHPYIELEGTRLWTAVESAINDLVLNNDLIESTARPYIVGYLCQKLLNERQAVEERVTVRSETISSNNLAGMEWDEGYFKFCNFVGCRCADCTFAGTRFPDSRFIDCELVNCKFIQDNLGGECDFSKTKA